MRGIEITWLRHMSSRVEGEDDLGSKTLEESQIEDEDENEYENDGERSG
jgi:hypothetical protein